MMSSDASLTSVSVTGVLYDMSGELLISMSHGCSDASTMKS